MHTGLLWCEGVYPAVRKVVSAVNSTVKNHVKNLLGCQHHVASGSRMLPWMQPSAVTPCSPPSCLAWILLSLQILTLEGRERDKERTNTIQLPKTDLFSSGCTKAAFASQDTLLAGSEPEAAPIHVWQRRRNGTTPPKSQFWLFISLLYLVLSSYSQITSIVQVSLQLSAGKGCC